MTNESSLKSIISLELTFIQSLGMKLFLCPFVGRKRLQILGYCIVYFLTLCTACQLGLTLLSAGTKDWLEIINIAPNLGVVIMTMIKYTKLHTHRELYEEIFRHFKDHMWDIVTPQCKEDQRIIKKYKFIFKFISRFLICYSVPLIIVVDSFPYLFMVYENKVNGNIEEYLYPYDGWYPFDKVKWYAVAYTWECCMTNAVICIYVFSNIVHITYIGYICMELRLLGNSLKKLFDPEHIDDITNGRNVNVIHRAVLKRLKVVIMKHEFLAKISSKIDAVLGDAMLLNYSLGAVFICLTAFTFTVVDNLFKRLRYFFMCMSLLVEVFNQCFIGQILSDHSVNLTEAIYSSDWLYASPEAKKIMLMFMMRTQKPFKLTGNGYIAMNMNSFSNICSRSYQFFNLLRTVYT